MTDTATTTAKACAQCAHWKALSGDQGECRARPPQAISFKVDDDVKFETRFPVTAGSDWCGEYQAK